MTAILDDTLTEMDFAEDIVDANNSAMAEATLHNKIVVVSANYTLRMIESHSFASQDGAERFLAYMVGNGHPDSRYYKFGGDIKDV